METLKLGTSLLYLLLPIILCCSAHKIYLLAKLKITYAQELELCLVYIYTNLHE